MSADLDDLSVRARRGLLSRAELRRFEASLAASPDAELLHRAGSEFDAESSVLPGDEKLATRIARRTLTARRGRARLPRVAHVAIAAAIVLAVTFAAAAASRWVAKSRARLASTAAEPPAAAAQAIAAPSIATPVPPTEDSVPAAPVDPAKPASAGIARRPPRAHHLDEARNEPRIDPPASAAMTAAELFAAAARARTNGETTKAIELYAALEHQYPTTPEARQSHVAIAMLYLRSGSSAAALDHFRTYLSANPDGALASDALWGQAEALSKLGRTDEARHTCEILLKRYPDSAYAEAARTKIGASQQQKP
jgi:TolA-binding protein